MEQTKRGQIHISIENDIYDRFKALTDALGTTPGAVVNMMIRQAVYTNAIPFTLSLNHPYAPSREQLEAGIVDDKADKRKPEKKKGAKKDNASWKAEEVVEAGSEDFDLFED